MELGDIIKFREENMSHNGVEEFFKNRGKFTEDYRNIFLSVEYLKDTYNTEIKLAETAIKKGCEYVTNIDYCSRVIAATGWIPK